MKSRKKLIGAMICALMWLSACGPKSGPKGSVSQPRMEDVPIASWEKLSQSRIYFGHKSVGASLMHGVADSSGFTRKSGWR